MAMGPNRWGASCDERKIDVGPSAPPMMPMDAASRSVNPRAKAPKKVAKMPSWAEAPKSTDLGLEINDEKSVSAPMPMKMSGGKIPEVTPQ